MPLDPVDVGNADALAEGDDEQRHRAREVVKQREYVVARAVAEDHRNGKTECADGACSNTVLEL